MSNWQHSTAAKKLIHVNGVWIDPFAIDAAHTDEDDTESLSVYLKGGRVVHIPKKGMTTQGILSRIFEGNDS